ncbi:uracil phosphoribosyltransferase [Halobacteriovorax sp. XZX-3]|uniref:uracil phosphoribosyltransferase n=1 Tax=unclassified Halobacteriovorax TaxID=2639665 RepID=UPI000CD2ACC7|nr:uracil phosphoribosyltransferase [Halobacteriovorax sp. DA5]POB12502.1 uracil phosphoribosyltransferase [Halobacteriovorax sp. DA5]
MKTQSKNSNQYKISQIEHKYGENVFILSNPLAESLLARFSSEGVIQPELNHLIHKLYFILLESVLGNSFPKEVVEVRSRMAGLTEKAIFKQEVIKREQPVLCVDLARAGTFPSHICFENLNYFLNPELIRQDHFYVQRKVDENEQVIGVDVSGSKIGGGQENAIVLLPDPMGATGGSMSFAVGHYKDKVKGRALKYISLNLIVTPEYIKRMQKDHPDVEIYALRLDRGLSPDHVLKTIPGTLWDEEVGLTGKQYIVPGAGGVGEILNNSFV